VPTQSEIDLANDKKGADSKAEAPKKEGDVEMKEE